MVKVSFRVVSRHNNNLLLTNELDWVNVRVGDSAGLYNFIIFQVNKEQSELIFGLDDKGDFAAVT